MLFRRVKYVSGKKLLRYTYIIFRYFLFDFEFKINSVYWYNKFDYCYKNGLMLD